MTELAVAVVKCLAALLGWFAAAKVDSIIGYWVAVASIAWEKYATQQMVDSFNQGVTALKTDLPAKYKDWEKWRSGK